MKLIDLDTTATDHHGLVTLTSSGLSRSAWYRAIDAGTLDQIHPGVARLVGTPPTYRQRIAAAVLATAPASTTVPDASDRSAALASHRSAASLWLGEVDRVLPDGVTLPVDLVFTDRRRSATLDDVEIHRPTDLRRSNPQIVDGI